MTNRVAGLIDHVLIIRTDTGSLIKTVRTVETDPYAFIINNML